MLHGSTLHGRCTLQVPVSLTGTISRTGIDVGTENEHRESRYLALLHHDNRTPVASETVVNCE